MNKQDYAKFTRAVREGQLLDALLKVPGYAERMHKRHQAHLNSEKLIKDLAVGEEAWTLNWAFSVEYPCWTTLDSDAYGTLEHIMRTKAGFVFLTSRQKGKEIV